MGNESLENKILELQELIQKEENKEVKTRLKKILKQQLDFQKYVILYPQIGVLADLSLGNENTNWEYIKRAYDEFEKRGVEEVFIVGNLLNSYSKDLPEKQSQEIYLQEIEKLKTNYPQDFKNYFVLGNNDLLYKRIGINVKTELMDLRSDFIPTSFGTTFTKWEDRNLRLCHKMSKDEDPSTIKTVDLNLYAGTGYFKYLPKYKAIKLPTCSDIHVNNRESNESRSGFLILENRDKGIVANRYGFTETGVERILKRVVK